MGRKPADFWGYAERMGNRFKCKFCKQGFPGGVVRLRSHLSGITGQGIQVCSKVPEDVMSAARLASKKKSKLETASSNSDITSSEIYDARCSNEVDSSLAKFFELNDVNCSIVESPSFINLVNVLIKSGSGYVLPNCSTLENQLILSLRKEVDQYVSAARQSWEEIGCTLASEIWRNEKENRSFISIMACSGKRAVLLNTIEIPNNNLTAAFLEEVVHLVVEYVGADKVIQYFVDDTRCSEEIAKLITSKCPHVFITRCVVRELQTFFEEVQQEVEWVRATFETAKCLVDAMYKDGDLLALMRKYIGGKEFKQYPGYDMLESIFDVREELVKFVQSHAWLASGYDQQENGKTATAIITSEEFWKHGEEVLIALKPLSTILHLDDASDSSFGYLYGLVKVAEEVISNLQTNKRDKYQKLWSIFELKKNRIIHEIHKAAAFLNPAYLCNATGQNSTQMEEGINYIIQKFVDVSDREAFVEQAMHYRRTLSDPHELFKTIAAKTSTPCEWWNEFGEKFPILKKHASKILCQPCGSSSYKSGLGAFRANLIKQRGLVPELNDLNVRMNLFLMEKCNADNEENKKKRINIEEFGQQKSTNGSSDAALVEPRHSDDETRLSTTREELPGPNPLKLCFITMVASPILTDQKVKGYQGCPIHVYLADSVTNCAVQDGAPSTLTLSISVLDGDFTNGASTDECRTREYFDRNDLSSDMMPLVTGDLQLTLVQGMGMLGEFSFNYNSRGTRSGKFRLAVKTFIGDCEGIRILEGISNAFVVEDNEVIRTQHPAALEMHLPKDSASLGVIAPMDGWWGGLEQMLGESSSSPGDWNGSIWNYNQLQRSCKSLTQIAARRVKKKALLWQTRSCNRRITMERRSPMLLNKEKIGNEVEAGKVTLGKNLSQQEDCEENNAEPLAVLKEINSSGTELKPIEDTFEVLSLEHISTALYEPIKPIGRGAYGIVWSSINRETNEKVAIMKIRNVFDNHVEALRTLREIKLLRHLRHDNVISLKDVMMPIDKWSFKDVDLVYEHMDTDLHQIIKSSQALTSDHCQYFLFQLLKGLEYLHSANILHRDLKPGNLLINANCDLKICDFGMAQTNSCKDQFMTKYAVTQWYWAPELLLCSENYGTSIDVWSVGCIFAELLGRKPLFPGTECINQLKLIINVLGSQREEDLEFIDYPKARKYIKSLSFSPGTPFTRLYPNAHPLAIDLLQKMLIFDPTKRITVLEALQHPYMAPLYDPALNPPAQVPIDLEISEELGEETIREMMWREMLNYHPEAIAAATKE